MGGRILEHEGKKIFNEGRKEGIAIGEVRGRSEGRIEGRSEAMNAALEFMRSNGMSNEQINRFRNSILN